MGIAFAPPAGNGHDKSKLSFDQISQYLSTVKIGHYCSGRNCNSKVSALGAGFQPTPSRLAVLSSKELLVAKICQRPQRIREHEADITAPAAIAAVGSTPGFKAQAFETDAPGAAIPGFHRNFGFIGKVPTWQFILS
jgi:hypothetical protein